MEYWQAEFDAIRAATARGILVIEAAGNGGQNLDHARYGDRFNRAKRDSGAILVGGGTSDSRMPKCWTNYGSRVDIQGWGENVMTTGYGDIKINGNDDNQWYTRSFSGTSSATPIVAGAVAALQGIRKNLGLPPLSAGNMRELLITTGTAQGNSSKHIGPLPNLRAAIKRTPLLIKYTAIWEKKQDTAWVARHGMTSTKYQQEFDKFVSQGYRLEHVSGYTVRNQARYAAIWVKKKWPCMDRASWSGLGRIPGNI